MTWLIKFWRSSIGGKVTMAVTGVLLFLFLIAHLLGNLQLLIGRDAINHYAEFLHSKPAMVWGARIALLCIFGLHVLSGLRLWSQNRAARPVAYAHEDTVVATWASRSMLLTGLTTAAFLIYHLLHFTARLVPPVVGDELHYQETLATGGERFDVYKMVTESFANPAIATAYLAFMVLLFFHLSHGLQSFAQTLGFHHGRYTPVVKKLSYLFAALIAGGNIGIVVACLTKVVQ